MPYPQLESLPQKSLGALGLLQKPADVARNTGRELATSTGASRLHELLTPSQAQALGRRNARPVTIATDKEVVGEAERRALPAGEAQQAMLATNMRSAPQPAHSWLLSVLAQQQRLRPSLPPGYVAPAAPSASSPASSFTLPAGYQPPAALLLPQVSQAPQHGTVSLAACGLAADPTPR